MDGPWLDLLAATNRLIEEITWFIRDAAFLTIISLFIADKIVKYW